MSAPKSHLEPEGFKLFRQGKTGVEIAELLDVSEPTVSKWRNKYEWERRRRAWQNSSIAISEKLMNLLAKDVEALDSIDNGAVDRITKAILSIQKLDQTVDMKASTIQVMEDFIAFLQSRNNKLYQSIQDVLPDFLMSQGQKYRKQ